MKDGQVGSVKLRFIVEPETWAKASNGEVEFYGEEVAELIQQVEEYAQRLIDKNSDLYGFIKMEASDYQ